MLMPNRRPSCDTGYLTLDPKVGSSELTIEFKFRVSTYNIRALTYNIKEFL